MLSGQKLILATVIATMQVTLTADTAVTHQQLVAAPIAKTATASPATVVTHQQSVAVPIAKTATASPATVVTHQQPVAAPTATPAHVNFGKAFLGPFAATDWQVKRETWKQKMNTTKGAVNLEAAKDQFRKDVILWYATMMQQPPAGHMIAGKKLEEKHLAQLKQTQDFLKRWVLMLASCPLSYVTKKNASSLPISNPEHQDLMPFAFPLAAALSHGQRMIVKLLDVTYNQMYNLLLSGDKNVAPTIDFMRSFASHQVSERGGELLEDKVFAGVAASIQGNHRGVNVPLGGVGNINELGSIIGPDGQCYQAGAKKHEGSYQLGHVYIRRDKFSSARMPNDINLASLLMGVESTAPGSTSPFSTGGKSHNVTSGAMDQTLSRSSTGGQKWEVLLPNMGPASYGGCFLNVSPAQFTRLEKLFSAALALPAAEQAALFSNLLMCNADEAHQALMDHPKLKSFVSPHAFGSPLVVAPKQ